MAQYDGAIRINTQINNKNANVQLMSLENRIVKTADKIAGLRSKMNALKDVKIPTQEYKKLEKEATSLEKSLLSLYDKQERFLSTGGKEKSSAYRKMIYDAETLEKKLKYAEQAMHSLVDSGEAFTFGSGTQEYANLGQQLKYAENEMGLLKAKHDVVGEKVKSTENHYKRLGKTGKSVFSAISKGAEVAKSGIKKIGDFAKTAFSRFTKSANSSKSSIEKFTSRLKGILSSLFIFNWVTRAFNSMISGMKEGYSNLYNDNKKFAHAINGLKSDFLTLKNSIASAFAPIITVAIPYLQALANAISSLMDKAAQFFAAITGQKTYLKAIKQTTSAIEEQGKEAAKSSKKQLSGLDKLNNLSSNDKEKNSSSGSGKMFEEAKVGNNFGDLVEKIKKMWEDADFTELGKTIGKKIKSALKSIPWSDIQKTAKKVGKSFATLINGLVEVPGLGTTIGSTIAKAINTGLTGLNAFSKNLKWEKVGKFFADGINGFFKTFDFKMAADAVNNTAQGILKALISCVENVKWKDIRDKIKTFIKNLDFLGVSFQIGNLAKALASAFNTMVSDPELFKEAGKKIADSINGFFKGMGEVDEKTGLTGWQELGQSISKSISGILTTINTALSDVDWIQVGNAIGQFIGSISWGEIFVNAGLLIVNALWAAIKIAVSALASDPLGIVSAITTVMAGWFVVGKLVSVASALKKSFTSILQTSLTNATNALKTGGIKGLLQTKLGKIGAIAISLTIAVQSIKWASSNWKELFDKYSLGEISEALDELFSDMFGDNGFSRMLSEISSGLGLAFSQDYGAEEWADAITQTFSDMWKGIKSTFSGIVGWFKDKFGAAWTGVKNAFSGASNFFSGVWNNIKSAFGNIAGWFKDKFSAAWQAVKDVFSTGGKIFDGIKDGILNGLKTVINAIIGGINKVIKVPFNGLNTALKTLKSVDIAGLKPFDWITTIDVPQIPKLATGAVIPANKEFLAVLGDQKHGRNLEAPEDLIRKIVREETANNNFGSREITVHVPVTVEERVLFDIIKKIDLEEYQRTGKPSFQT